MLNVRLGVNIDHVATLRQARGTKYPSVVFAARTALKAGADQITIHLREDRRHIQDADMAQVKKITDEFNKPLNFEMGACKEIVDIAIATQPAWVCLVPEKREEQTTEGGLNLNDNEQYKKIQETCQVLKEGIKDLKISLFVEADEKILQKCIELEIDAVEIHTGDYANDFNEGKTIGPHLEKYKSACKQITDAGIGFHAGHGLTDESLAPLILQGLFVEYNIGHWIIAESVFEGLANTVLKLKEIIAKGVL